MLRWDSFRHGQAPVAGQIIDDGTQRVNGDDEAMNNGIDPGWYGNVYQNYGGQPRNGVVNNTLNSTPYWYGNPDGTSAAYTVEGMSQQMMRIKSYGSSGMNNIGITSWQGIGYIFAMFQRQQRFVEASWVTNDTVPDFQGINFMGTMLYGDTLAPGRAWQSTLPATISSTNNTTDTAGHLGGGSAVQLRVPGKHDCLQRNSGEHADFRRRAFVPVLGPHDSVPPDRRSGLLLRRAPESGVQLQLAGHVHREPRAEPVLHGTQREQPRIRSIKLMAGIKFTDYLPYALINLNSPSPTLAADNVLSLPIATGAQVGGSFHVNAQQAASLSTAAQPCYAGWYRIVRVDPGATAANIAYGYVGAMAALTTLTAPNAAAGDTAVTSYDQALAPGVGACVFLGPVTPGNYTVVLDAGDCNVYVTGTTTLGQVLTATNTGNGQAAPSTGSPTFAQIPLIIGVATVARTGAGLVRARIRSMFGQGL